MQINDWRFPKMNGS